METRILTLAASTLFCAAPILGQTNPIAPPGMVGHPNESVLRLRPEERQQLLKRCDANRNGKIDVQEHRAYVREEARILWERRSLQVEAASRDSRTNWNARVMAPEPRTLAERLHPPVPAQRSRPLTARPQAGLSKSAAARGGVHTGSGVTNQTITSPGGGGEAGAATHLKVNGLTAEPANRSEAGK